MGILGGGAGAGATRIGLGSILAPSLQDRLGAFLLVSMQELPSSMQAGLQSMQDPASHYTPCVILGL